jgi:putative transposase
VPIETFLAVVAEGIAEHNAREGRRSPTCAGRSFDATFAASYASVPIRRATAEQRRLWLMAAEAVRVRGQDGTIHLFGNRYWSEFLLAHRGSQVVVRFDPEALAEPLHVYAADGRYLGAADCQEAAGFDSVEAAQAQARRWKQFLRATKQATEIQERMSIAELARRLPRIEAAEPPEPKLVRPLFQGNAARRVNLDAERQQEDEARVLRALAGGGRPALRVIEDEDE